MIVCAAPLQNVPQRGEHRGGGERERLSHSDLVRKQQARHSVVLPVGEKRRYERALSRLKTFASAIDRRFGKGSPGQFAGSGLLEADFNAIRYTANLFDDGVGKRVGVGPENLELLL
ncbi:MAG TPA: hypothetical protein PK849_13565 [Synergistales bacterium]|nr:hypothetical protein [Synergistaceae bacterium]HPE67203.1 hypothetical protein [Synergistales bacterium]